MFMVLVIILLTFISILYSFQYVDIKKQIPTKIRNETLINR